MKKILCNLLREEKKAFTWWEVGDLWVRLGLRGAPLWVSRAFALGTCIMFPIMDFLTVATVVIERSSE